MRYNIKSRIAALGLKSVDIINMLRDRGINTDSSTFSSSINGRRRTEKADTICEVTDVILTELENKKG